MHRRNRIQGWILRASFVLTLPFLLIASFGCSNPNRHTTDSRLQKIDEMLNADLPKGTSKSKVVFYLSSPTSGAIQDISQSSTGTPTDVADGSIEAQSGGGPFTGANITGTYALNWSGLSVQQGSAGIIDEEDLLAQTTVTSLALSGTSDIFQFTNAQPQTGLAVGGSITFNGGDGTGGDGIRTNMSVIYNKSSGSTVNCVVYIATPQLAFFANKDNQGTTRIVAGVLRTQQ